MKNKTKRRRNSARGAAGRIRRHLFRSKSVEEEAEK